MGLRGGQLRVRVGGGRGFLGQAPVAGGIDGGFGWRNWRGAWAEGMGGGHGQREWVGGMGGGDGWAGVRCAALGTLRVAWAHRSYRDFVLCRSGNGFLQMHCPWKD